MNHTIKQLLLQEACELYNAQNELDHLIEVNINENDEIKFNKVIKSSIPCSAYDEKQWYTWKVTKNKVTKIRPPNIDDAVETIMESNHFEEFDRLLTDFLYERLHSTQFQPTDELKQRVNTSLKELKTKLNSLAKCKFEVLEGESLDRDLKNEILLYYCKSYNARNVKFNGVTLYLNIDEKNGDYVAKLF
jgi:hypothetical protein